MKKIFTLSLAILSSWFCIAQQDPIYGLYMNNPSMINPAYTGINNNLMANMSFRNQWSNFDGNPTTMAANGHISLRDNKMGAGLLFMNDKIGENNTTQVNASYAYKLNLRNKVFSFGMQAGMVNFKTDPGQLQIQNPGDPAFAQFSDTKFNIGAGAILKNDKFMIGFSVPHLLGNTVKDAIGYGNLYQQHFYLQGAYTHYLNSRIYLKPYALIRGVKGAPISVDFNFNVNIDRNYTVGTFTRNLKSYGALLQYEFKEKYRITYLFELPSNSSVGTRFTTNEIMLSFRAPVFSYHDRMQSTF